MDNLPTPISGLEDSRALLDDSDAGTSTGAFRLAAQAQLKPLRGIAEAPRTPEPS